MINSLEYAIKIGKFVNSLEYKTETETETMVGIPVEHYNAMVEKINQINVYKKNANDTNEKNIQLQKELEKSKKKKLIG